MIDFMHTIFAVAVALIGYIGYQRFCHPLARYPGPFWASITDLWSLSLSVKGDWPSRLQALHAKYGPVVRIAPNEVAIDKPEAIAAIYGLNQGNVKTSFYVPFGNPAQKPNLFNAVDDQYHGQLRRWSGNIFSNKATSDFEPLIRSGIAGFIQHLNKNEGTVVDFAIKFREIAFDLSALISCGHTFDAINQGDSTGLMKAMFISNSSGAHFGRFPMAQILLTKLAPPPDLVRGFKFMSEFFHEKLLQHRNEQEMEADATDQMALLLKQSQQKSDTPYNLLEPSLDARIKEMCQTVIAAGSETTGSTLTALLYYVETNPDVRKKLVAEVEAVADELLPDGTFPASVVVKLAYVDAVIKETLRMHPAVAYSLPRKVRSGGIMVGDAFIPGGTCAGVNAWQIHRHPEIFGDRPNSFRPERWLSANKEFLTRMDRHMFAFGAGSRTCIGKHISLLEMRMLVPVLYHHFRFDLAELQVGLSYSCHWFALPDHLRATIERSSNTAFVAGGPSM